MSCHLLAAGTGDEDHRMDTVVLELVVDSILLDRGMDLATYCSYCRARTS